MNLVSVHAAFLVIAVTSAFTTVPSRVSQTRHPKLAGSAIPLLATEDWKGDVVSNTPDGQIQGCTLQLVDGSTTEWIVTIDGIEADLGPFSDAIYRKIMGDAKQQKFQGFRPGTIPPHLEPTYKAFAMDECARETVLEALQQNDIRPFESNRGDIILENFCVPPPLQKRKKGGRKKKKKEENDAVPGWCTYDTMKEAISAGWKPGQSFSFIAKNVKGQKVKSEDATTGAQPLGLNF